MRIHNKLTAAAVSAIFMSALAIPAMASAQSTPNNPSVPPTSPTNNPPPVTTPPPTPPANQHAYENANEHSALNRDQPVSDTSITTQVKSQLMANGGMASQDVSVHTMNGVVTLSGTVDSQYEKNQILQAAQSVDGVIRVDSSGLTVSVEPSTSGSVY